MNCVLMRRSACVLAGVVFGDRTVNAAGACAGAADASNLLVLAQPY